MSRFFLAALAGLAFALVPATSSAISLQEILSLSRAGVSSQVIVALIQRDKDVFTLTADQIVGLKKEGVSDEVLAAIVATRATDSAAEGPTVIIVGRGPNDSPTDAGEFAGLPPGPFGPVVVPYVVAVPYGAPPISRPYHRRVRRQPSPTTGIFFTTPVRGIFFEPFQPAPAPFVAPAIVPPIAHAAR